MRNYLKYLGETRVFWILTLIVSVIFSLVLSFVEINESHITDTIIDDKYVQYLAEFESKVYVNGLDASNLLQSVHFGGILIMIIMGLVAVIYHFTYGQNSDNNVLRRLPFANGFVKIYELITAAAVSVIGLSVSFVGVIMKIGNFNKRLLTFYETNKISVIRTNYEDPMNPKQIEIMLADIFGQNGGLFGPKGFLRNVEVYFDLGLIVLCALLIIYLFGVIFKYAPIGYIVGTVISIYLWNAAGVSEHFRQASKSAYGVPDYTAIAGILALLLAVCFVIAARKEQPEKHKLFNYPGAIYLIAAGVVIDNNIQLPVYRQFQYWFLNLINGWLSFPPLDFFLLAAYIIFLVIRKRKMVITEVPVMKHKGAFFEITKPNILFTVVTTIAVAALYSYRLLCCANASFYSELLTDSAYLRQIVENDFNVIIGAYVICKLCWFILKKSAVASEKFDRQTVSKRQLFIIQTLSEFVSVALPTVLDIGLSGILSHAVSGNNGFSPNLEKGMLYLSILALVVAAFTFADYAYSKFMFKVSFLIMGGLISSAAVLTVETGFVIKGAYVGNVTEVMGLYPTIGSILAVTLILLVGGMIVCKCDLSRSTFRSVISEPVYIIFAVLAYAVIGIGCGEQIWQWVLIGTAGLIILCAYIVYRIVSNRKQVVA